VLVDLPIACQLLRLFNSHNEERSTNSEIYDTILLNKREKAMRISTWINAVCSLFISIILIACDSGRTAENVAELQSPLPENGINILFIGNSLTYSNGLPAMLERLLITQGVEIGLVESIAFPNFGLPDHWAKASTRARLREPGWDIVVLQQGPSATEGRPYLLDYTPLFAEEARASGGRAALYMVWPWKARFFDFARVSDSYATAARENDAFLYPAGEAWLAAWEVDPNLQLYSNDDFHPSVLGTYLSALTMLEQIAHIDLNTLPTVIPATSGDIEITARVATILQNAAKKANLEFALVYP
jgi:hypothetical protein